MGYALSTVTVKEKFMKKTVLSVLFFLCCCGNLTAGTLGDVNGDGKVDITEAVYSLQTAAGLKPVIPDGSPVFADDQGRVGIGTAEPSANLDVKGNFSRRLIGRVGVPKNSKTVVGVGTLFTEELKTGDSVIIADEVFTVSEIVSNSQLVLNSPHSTGTNDSEIHADSTLFSVRNGDGVEKLTVDKSGNVGIGTEEPKAKLDIAGDIAVNGIDIVSELNELKQQVSKLGTMPKGIILPWYVQSGPVPDGWYICDGSNGTPDLLNKFLMGVGGFADVGATGGKNEQSENNTLGHALTIDEMPAHSHNTKRSESTAGDGVYPAGNYMGNTNPANAGTVSDTGGGNAHYHKLPNIDNRPAYVSVIFIMKVK